MEKNESTIADKLNSLCERYNISHNLRYDFISEIKKLLDESKSSICRNNEKTLKPFNLEAARDGKPVCTRDGQKARIICFDRKGLYPIVALIEYGDKDERIGAFSNEGRTDIYEMRDVDLVMLPERHEGWINIFEPTRKDDNPYLATCGCVVYKTKEAAIAGAVPNGYIATVKIEWEE